MPESYLRPEHRAALIESASILYAVQKVSGDKVREQMMKVYGRLTDAHLLITGVLADILVGINGEVTPSTSTFEEKNSLFAAFVIGMELCERAISEGRYLQASALLRQEMEILAQLKAISANNRKENRSPNISSLDESMARLYGDLSAAAHSSKHHIIDHVTNGDGHFANRNQLIRITRFFPELDETLARRLFTLHLYTSLRLIEELSGDLNRRRSETIGQREVEALELAVQLMVDDGMLERVG